VRAPLTARQEQVVAQLYERHGWSCGQIAEVLGVGRRLVENVLHRRGVALTHRGRWRRQPTPGVRAAREWFAAAARPEQADDVKVEQQEWGGAYRRRRCPSCELLTAYVHRCPRCGHDFDANVRADRDVEQTYDEETHR